MKLLTSRIFGARLQTPVYRFSGAGLSRIMNSLRCHTHPDRGIDEFDQEIQQPPPSNVACSSSGSDDKSPPELGLLETINT
ncbi:hypothetical protein AVEN_178854-1 [Araneus ventricosus]|uniref:Uncharacterized protein n=1 Tax=Araneus ventricosus TaxID=182803 RepID=A0A4Y2BFB0_ARAVE|nr:hypothetical protein AVEN_178854-1 [Araneus ventricosus]